jgi:hypothetical protein
MDSMNAVASRRFRLPSRAIVALRAACTPVILQLPGQRQALGKAGVGLRQQCRKPLLQSAQVGLLLRHVPPNAL